MSALSLTAALLAALCAAAAEPPEVPPPPEVPSAGESDPAGKPPAASRHFEVGTGKLEVSSDRASRRKMPPGEDGAERSRVRFEGRVRAKRGDLELSAEEVEVLFAARPAEEGGKSRLEPLVASARGEVVIRTPRRKALGGEAVYDFGAERFTLAGERRPVIFQDGDAVAAESFVVHRLQGVFEARGAVSAVILPRKEPAGASEEDAGRERPPLRAEKGGPSLARRTRIDCSRGAVYEEAGHRLFLAGDVLVRQKGFSIACDRLWVLFEPGERKPDPAGEKPPEAGRPALAEPRSPGSVKRVLVAGNVVVRSETRTAEAQIGAYDPETGTVTLGGKDRAPVIREGRGYLTAPLIIYHLKDDRIESPNGPFRAVVRQEEPGGETPPGPIEPRK